MKDQIGNRIKEGHLVQLKFPNGFTLNGHVVEVNEGGIALVGGTRKHKEEAVTQGFVKVKIEIEAAADPRTHSCPNILRLADPDKEILEESDSIN